MLNYKSSNIAKAELKYNYNFFEVVGSFGESIPSMLKTTFMLEAGGLTEDEAYDTIDRDGIDGAYKLSVEGLMESGFLGKGKAAQEAKREAKKALASLEATESTGETANS